MAGSSKPKSKFDFALAIAAMGFRVFPLETNGKRPVIDAWLKKASANPVCIRNWWTDPVMGWERDCNIGVTGGVFLDVDRKHGVDGGDSLADLTERNNPLPSTLHVLTPSGGEHFYFKDDPSIHNSAGRLGPGLDIRGVGGYVVGPGSTIDGKEYRQVEGYDAVAVCPEWLADLARKVPRMYPNPKRRVAPGVTLDSNDATTRAVQYLDQDAPLAIEGAGGDDTAFRVAAWVKDFGISEGSCLELMMDHWNERCAPPWPPDELETKVANAYRYGVEEVGAVSPEADFGKGKKSPEAKKSKLAPRFWSIPLPDEIASREWVLGTLLLKGYLTVLISPPGGSKSTMALHAALAVVTGRKEIIGMPVSSRQKVWIYNNEDGENEWKLRLSSAALHHRIKTEELMINSQPALAINTGDEQRLLIARRSQDGSHIEPYHLHPLLAFVQEHQFGVLIVDPFLETHEAKENSNEEINRVATMFRAIAKRANCAVLLIHHSNKPPGASSEGRAGDMNSARGASSLLGVARVAVTLEGMSAQEAKRYGLQERERGLYVRMDDAKANLALKSHEPRWFRKVSIPVPTRDTATTLKFENVGALEVANLNQPSEENLEEKFVQDVADALDGKSITVQALATRLREESPLYSDESDKGIRNRIMEIFVKPQKVSKWIIHYQLREDRSWGKHFVEVKEADNA